MQPNAGNSDLTLTIDGMSCGHCVRAVSAALAGVPGVAVRSVEIGHARIAASDTAAVALAIAALADEGYTARAGAPATGAPRGRGCCG